MKLLNKQEHAIWFLKDNVTEEVLYGGAAGGGKTALGCLWLMEMCQKHPGTRWLMGRSKLKNLKETTLNTFFELAATLNLGRQFTYRAADNLIVWKNGSEILLKDLFHYPSDPNFDSLGSLEITGAFIDECTQVAYHAWQIVKSRIRYKLTENKLIPKMLGSCNPAKNWAYKEFYKPSREGSLPKWRQFVQSLPTDNPHLHPGYLQSLLRLDKNSRERLYYGNWEYDDDPATLISHDAIMDYFNAVHLQPEGQKYLTIDVARKGKDKTVFRVWHGWLCIKRESIAKSGIDTVVAQAKALQKKYGISPANTIADEDGVGGGVVDFLKCKGFVNNSSPLEMKQGNAYIKPNFENLKSQCSIKMAEMIEMRKAGEQCDDDIVMQTTIEEMEQVKLRDIDKDGKQGIIAKDRIKEHLGRSPDEWDSIMMRYWFALKKDYLIRVKYWQL
ncbi:phage terminase large subunit [Flavobacterium sp. J372]|uniref:phage terminase large subunit n=1 Tax=Flavobacterium sp. J372 TaxID=2898436 RepID=UPI002151E307|nr:phage terminase large subunit [Flavobacterium sp. J372]MCR5863055.1 phage terminase large subunit [Flavobacterium sp. J372]